MNIPFRGMSCSQDSEDLPTPKTVVTTFSNTTESTSSRTSTIHRTRTGSSELEISRSRSMSDHHDHYSGSFQAVYENLDVLRLILSWLDISSLVGLYVAAGRRDVSHFCRAITMLHTGYYTSLPAKSDSRNEEYFGELFNSRNGLSFSVLSQLQSLVLLARSSSPGLPFSPLSYGSVIRFMRRIGNQLQAGARMLHIEDMIIDIADDPTADLISKVTMCKLMVMTCRYQIIHRYSVKLRYLYLDSTFTGVADGESALEGIRVACPKLERLDLWISVTVDDFMYFTDATTIWPNLRSLDVGRLIYSFIRRLELEHYFADSGITDCAQRVCCAVAASLTKHKFPRLEQLEIYASDSIVFMFCNALLQRWVINKHRTSAEIGSTFRTHSGYRNFSSPFHDLYLANVPVSALPTDQFSSISLSSTTSSMGENNSEEDFFIPLDSIKHSEVLDYHPDMDIFVGEQVRGLHICSLLDVIGGNEMNGQDNPFAGHGTGQGWASMMKDVVAQKGLSSCCLFPKVLEVVFQPDVPHPYAMLLVSRNSSLPPSQQQSTQDSSGLTVRVHGPSAVNVMLFLDQSYSPKAWNISRLFHDVDCSSAIRVRRHALAAQSREEIGDAHSSAELGYWALPNSHRKSSVDEKNVLSAGQYLYSALQKRHLCALSEVTLSLSVIQSLLAHVRTLEREERSHIVAPLMHHCLENAQTIVIVIDQEWSEGATRSVIHLMNALLEGQWTSSSLLQSIVLKVTSEHAFDQVSHQRERFVTDCSLEQQHKSGLLKLSFASRLLVM